MIFNRVTLNFFHSVVILLYQTILKDELTKQWSFMSNLNINIFGIPGVHGVDANIIPAWHHTLGNPDISVAVIDAAIYTSHLLFNIDMPTSSSLEINVINKENMKSLSGYTYYHGTFVCGIVKMIAPKVSLIPLSLSESTYCDIPAAVKAIEVAKRSKVRIVNCSWGAHELHKELYDSIHNSDILYVCAAGNNRVFTDKKPYYPGCFDFPNVISVAATNNRGSLWLPSNYGSQISLAAPGASILGPIPSIDNKSFTYDSGTSLATAHVTGVAALILSVYPKLNPHELKKILISSCTKLPDLKGKIQSAGIVNAYAALIEASKYA